MRPNLRSALQPGERARVLLVDDEPAVLRVLKTILESCGCITAEAGDGNEALRLLISTSFDVVISDVSMPGCNGLEFLRMVRERDLDVPVILITGEPSLESANRALEYGAFRYLVKPLSPKSLKDAVELAVRLHEVARLKRKALELQQIDERWLGDRAALEARFEKAMAGMCMAFQPIVSFAERQVYGYEALLTSTEPTLSNPLVFLETAEKLGRLRELGRAIRQRVASAEVPGQTLIFVNLHAADLNDEQLYFPGAPLSKLAERVVLEITERSSLHEIPDLKTRIAKLRRLGFQIAIDDLGAGYAGLSSFTLLDPQVAKLDMSLIRGIDLEPKKQSIVRSMARLCGELGIELVSEGVETVEERRTLVELGCNLFQGYLFARPSRDFATPRHLSAPPCSLSAPIRSGTNE